MTATARTVRFGMGRQSARSKPRAPPVPHEHAEQVALIEWVALSLKRYPALRWLYAVPNGGVRHAAVAGKLKAEGVRRGVPDLCLPVARRGYHGAYIEMKRSVGGCTSPEQEKWAEHLKAEGYAYCLALGFEPARAFLIDYLEPT